MPKLWQKRSRLWQEGLPLSCEGPSVESHILDRKGVVSDRKGLTINLTDHLQKALSLTGKVSSLTGRSTITCEEPPVESHLSDRKGAVSAWQERSWTLPLTEPAKECLISDRKDPIPYLRQELLEKGIIWQDRYLTSERNNFWERLNLTGS